ncbi:hypothetical protein BRAS3809_320001 [Bradyrhizobium sp. STM 3809]|nr:hypothetical protein BRAS3809_320001 [Bradyrhizobium sp. STM 3809]
MPITSVAAARAAILIVRCMEVSLSLSGGNDRIAAPFLHRTLTKAVMQS